MFIFVGQIFVGLEAENFVTLLNFVACTVPAKFSRLRKFATGTVEHCSSLYILLSLMIFVFL